MKSNHTLFFALLLIAILSACTSDKKTATLLLGKWVLTEAKRNGNPTELLTGAYFEFTDGKLKTNLLGEDAEADYTIDNGKIVQTTPQAITYDIEITPAQQLILRTTLRKSDFVLTLQKQ